MRKRLRADYLDDHPWLPSLTVYEPERGLKRPIGFVRFRQPPKPAKPRQRKPAAKRK
jgi:hypothetical protein